ncbi:hypothetical protein ADEAN_000323500 [Angomonas deanei]|uniref:Uncharacterized protein n=1 Tax=Angomonas deanei TaxID=59799 RepID=A0A7G2CA88_9TRYP|nr:hypothetical protein ADEAN_000323500 [Angomonas deanei]
MSGQSVAHGTVEDFQSLQNISKELAPVKNALLKLKKRVEEEDKTVNTNNETAVSLDKVAARILQVMSKYKALEERLSNVSHLAEEEQWAQYKREAALLSFGTASSSSGSGAPLGRSPASPAGRARHATQNGKHTQFTKVDALKEEVEAAQQERRSTQERIQHYYSGETNGTHGDPPTTDLTDVFLAEGTFNFSNVKRPKDAEDGPLFLPNMTPAPGYVKKETTASQPVAANATKGSQTHQNVFRDVCPTALPYCLSASSYLRSQKQLQMQVDMVRYLIQTGRREMAILARDTYGLSPLWFPELLHDQSHPNNGGIEKGIATSLLNTPSLTCAKGTRVEENGSKPDTELHTPLRDQKESPGKTASHSGSRSNGNQPVTPLHTPSGASRHETLPLLAARVAAMGLFLKDEYIERMIVERALADDFYTDRNRRTVPDAEDLHNGSTHEVHVDPQDGTSATEEEENEWTLPPPPHLGTEEDLTASQPIAERRGSNSTNRSADIVDDDSDDYSTVYSGEEEEGAPSSEDNQPEPAVEVGGDDLEQLLWMAQQYRRYDSAVVRRMRAIPPDHYSRQSGNDRFDRCVMALVESQLYNGLSDVPSISGHILETPSQESHGSESLLNEDGLLRAKRTRNSAEDLFAMEDTFSASVLCFKRPTRYYCCTSGLLLSDANHRGDGVSADPKVSLSAYLLRALYNGEEDKEAYLGTLRKDQTPYVLPSGHMFSLSGLCQCVVVRHEPPEEDDDDDSWQTELQDEESMGEVLDTLSEAMESAASSYEAPQEAEEEEEEDEERLPLLAEEEEGESLFEERESTSSEEEMGVEEEESDGGGGVMQPRANTNQESVLFRLPGANQLNPNYSVSNVRKIFIT